MYVVICVVLSVLLRCMWLMLGKIKPNSDFDFESELSAAFFFVMLRQLIKITTQNNQAIKIHKTHCRSNYRL